MLYKEDITCDVTLHANSEREGYTLICINELLHNLGLISEQDYATTYAKLTDNDYFKIF